MTGTDLDRCTACGAVLGPWEKGRCACTGPRSGTIREVLYSIACTARQPLHARDFVRNAERDHGLHFNMGTALVALSQDFRFCWAGRGLYGLYRHGPLPGPRNLREATRIVLLAAGTPLSHEAVDFCLKRLGYRYSLASLRQAVAKTAHIRWEYGQWDHSRGEAAELELRNQIPIVPPRQPRPWNALHAEIKASVTASIADLAARQGALADLSRFGLDWNPDLLTTTASDTALRLPSGRGTRTEGAYYRVINGQRTFYAKDNLSYMAFAHGVDVVHLREILASAGVTDPTMPFEQTVTITGVKPPASGKTQTVTIGHTLQDQHTPSHGKTTDT